jgi:hypothetical protein
VRRRRQMEKRIDFLPESEVANASDKSTVIIWVTKWKPSLVWEIYADVMPSTSAWHPEIQAILSRDPSTVFRGWAPGYLLHTCSWRQKAPNALQKNQIQILTFKLFSVRPYYGQTGPLNLIHWSYHVLAYFMVLLTFHGPSLHILGLLISIPLLFTS